MQKSVEPEVPWWAEYTPVENECQVTPEDRLGVCFREVELQVEEAEAGAKQSRSRNNGAQVLDEK